MINQKGKSEKSLKSDYFGRGEAPVSEGGGHEHKQHGSCRADYLLTAGTATGRGRVRTEILMDLFSGTETAIAVWIREVCRI